MISLLIGQCERHLILSLNRIGQISLLLSHITQMITAALLTDKRASPALEIQTRQIAEMSLSLSLSQNKIIINLLGLITEEYSSRRQVLNLHWKSFIEVQCPVVVLVRIENVFTFFKIFTNSDRYLRYKTARDILDLEETNKKFCL